MIAFTDWGDQRLWKLKPSTCGGSPKSTHEQSPSYWWPCGRSRVERSKLLTAEIVAKTARLSRPRSGASEIIPDSRSRPGHRAREHLSADDRHHGGRNDHPVLARVCTDPTSARPKVGPGGHAQGVRAGRPERVSVRLVPDRAAPSNRSTSGSVRSPSITPSSTAMPKTRNLPILGQGHHALPSRPRLAPRPDRHPRPGVVKPQE